MRFLALLVSVSGLAWSQTTVVVSGRITDTTTGLPVSGAAVTLEQQTGGTKMAFTDERGTYSFVDASMGPGQVDVQTVGFQKLSRTNPEETSVRITSDHASYDFALLPTARIKGVVVDKDSSTPVDGSVEVLRENYSLGVRRFVRPERGVRWIAADGSFEFSSLDSGDYIVVARPLLSRDDAELPAAGNGYRTTLYYGAEDPDSALIVTVKPGEERIVNFSLIKRRLWRVSGNIVSSRNAIGELSLMSEAITGQPAFVEAVDLPGSFAVTGLPAGRYEAEVRTVGHFAHVPFTIADHDVEGLRIVVPESVMIRGTFQQLSGHSPLPSGLSVQVASPELEFVQAKIVAAAEDGAFFFSVDPMSYSVQAKVPLGYAVAEIRYGGIDYLNSLIPLGGSTQGASLTIAITDHPGNVTGSVSDAEAKPIPASIVMVPDPLPIAFDLRAIRVAASDERGNFTFSSAMPGKYKLIALTGDDRKRHHDLAVLVPKVRQVDAFEVRADQTVYISLRP